jgi:hypothetical protein
MKKIIMVIPLAAIVVSLTALTLLPPPFSYGQLAGEGIHGGGGGSSASAVSGKVCKIVTNPSASDTHLLFDIASTRTVTKIWGICYGGTSAVATLYNAGADGSGSTAIHSALTVDTNGANTETISSATLTTGDVIYLTVGTVTGVVTQLTVCYE